MTTVAPFGRAGRLRPLIGLVVILAGCGGAPSDILAPTSREPAASAPSSASMAEPSASASAGSIAAEFDRLLADLERIHPEPFHAMERDEFVAALDEYEAQLPELTPEEAAVGLMRVWAMLSRERDGHQFALPEAGHEYPVLPIRIYEFAEGVHITAARNDPSLVGARITAIGDTPIGEVLDAVEPLVPRDGPDTVHAHRPILLLRTEVLRGLGLVGEGMVAVTVEQADGTERTIDLQPMPFDEYTAWAGPFGIYQLPIDSRIRYLASDESFSAELLDGGTAYLSYRFVELPILSEVRGWIEEAAVQRLVLDLRQNPGGDNGTYGSLLDLVVGFADSNPGSVTVITDRITFSAASNLATEIEQRTDARFVGEPMGGGLNFWNDVTWLELPSLPIPMRAAVSTTYWKFAPEDDERLTIEPDVRFEVSAADHFAGRDPALEAALSD